MKFSQRLRLSRLKYQTREQQSKWWRRELGVLKSNTLSLTLLALVSGFLGARTLNAEHVIKVQDDTYHEMALVAAMRGCPVFTPVTSIVISGNDPVKVRQDLGRIATDIDRFNATLQKLTRGK